MKSTPINKRRFIHYGLPAKYAVLSVLLATFFVWWVFPCTSTAEELQVQGGGENAQVYGDSGVATPAGDGQQNAEFQQTGEQPLDAYSFDPENMPESAPIPDADWVFEVPVDVQNLSQEVQGILILCGVAKEEIQISADTGETTISRTIAGGASKELSLVNGSYQGNVMIGVNFDQNMAGSVSMDQINKYNCNLYLKHQDGFHGRASSSENAPTWRKADPDHPFQWRLGWQPLPEYEESP